MKLLPLLISIACLNQLPARADWVVRSPDRAEVSTFSTVKWSQFRRLPSTGELVASVTFSNEHYVSDTEPQRDERFDFVFPNVQWDSLSGTYVMKSAGGEPRTIAAVKRGVLFNGIELA